MLNLQSFMPEISLAVTAIAVILLDIVVRRKAVLAGVGIAGLLISVIFTVAMWAAPGVDASGLIFNNMVAVDGFALFFKLLFAGIAILVILASVDYTSKMPNAQGEYYALVLLSALGMMLMASTTELISIYVSLELASLSLCALVCFLKDRKSSEAALKYILLSGVVSAVLLFGMALVFGVTGQTQLGEIARAIQSLSISTLTASPALVLGLVLLVAGFGFKIAAVPFHMWVPDVYEGAPTPVTAYLSVASKAAGFAVILRVFSSAFGAEWFSSNWGTIFAVLAAVSMTLGNVAALPQTNIKRMLGYSSIAQAGYLMVGLSAVGVSPGAAATGQSGILFFLASYALANLAAFSAIIAITNKINSDDIDRFAGMFKRAPALALALTLSLISLIGMPPAAGFIAKFYIFSAGVRAGLLWLVVIAVLNSVISAYYYLRVVKVMWFGEPESVEKVPSSGALRIALLVASIGVLVLGIAPALILKLTEAATSILAFLP